MLLLFEEQSSAGFIKGLDSHPSSLNKHIQKKKKSEDYTPIH